MTVAWIEVTYAAIAGMLLLAVLSIVFASWRNGISPMPASGQVRRKTAELLRQLDVRGTVIEAGSGWGSLALHLGRHCPNLRRIVGIENSLVPYLASRLVVRLSRSGGRDDADRSDLSHERITMLRRDLFAYGYSDADAVVCYLYPGAMRRLGPLLAEHMKPGSCVISLCFAIPGWEPERVVRCRDLYRTPIYCYRVD